MFSAANLVADEAILDLGTEMTDVTGPFNEYRECARLIWNIFLRPAADADRVDSFDSIRDRLFAHIVLSRVGKESYRRADSSMAIPFVVVEPTLDDTPIMVQRAGGGLTRYWDDPTRTVAPHEAKLTYVDSFDWDQFGYRDFTYVMVRVEEWQGKSELVGRLALIQTTNVKVVAYS